MQEFVESGWAMLVLVAVFGILMCGAVVWGMFCRIILPFAAGLAIASAAFAQAPTWTILRTACWEISATAGQCAVNVRGRFPTREACIAGNGGQLNRQEVKQEITFTDGCKMLLE